MQRPKNRLKFIIQFADVNSAVNRWVATSSMCMEIQNRLREFAGLNTSDPGNKEASTSRKRRDQKDLKEVKRVIKECINPFGERCSTDTLFSLKTGKQASETFLLTFEAVGKRRRDEFIEGFRNDPENFESPITKIKCQNFASENQLKKNKSKKVQEIANIKGTCDLYGHYFSFHQPKGLILTNYFLIHSFQSLPVFVTQMVQ